MASGTDNLHALLKKWFGFSTFKGSQEAIIRNLLAGNDSLVLMPTGGGKSLCYQLPAIMLPGLAVVVSPLIALMKNQVDLLRGNTEHQGMVHFLNSTLRNDQTLAVKREIESGTTKLLYVSPEWLTRPANIEFLQNLKVSFFAIDEAHCITEWGHDFRPEYTKIRANIDAIGRTPIMALTATATPKVQKDILKNLQIPEAHVFVSSFNRPNLFYEIRPKENSKAEIIRYIKENPGKSGIVYCKKRMKVDAMAEVLQTNGISALPYHAGLDQETRTRHQDAFIREEVQIIVATIAFGMGIDKPDIRFVIHADMPKSLEGYYQETGRAGRDGGEGRCIAFYHSHDMQGFYQLLQGKSLKEQDINRQMIQETIQYAEGGDCRRAMLLPYFGEVYDKPSCGSCDNCLHPPKRFEAKEPLLTALILVNELTISFKAQYYVDILIGKETSKNRYYQHTLLTQFGKWEKEGEDFWRSIFRQAVLHQFLEKDIVSYGELHITAKGKRFIQSPHRIEFVRDHNYDIKPDKHAEVEVTYTDQRNELYSILKQLRKDEARKRKLPPYVIFSDEALLEMTTLYPIKTSELLYISGVSQGKARLYGAPFIKVIQDYIEEHEIDRPQSLIIRGKQSHSSEKMNLISCIDRQMDLYDIAKEKNITFDKLLSDIEALVDKGTSLNLSYFISTLIEQDVYDEIYSYFLDESEDGSLEEAIKAFADEDIEEDEIRLVRIQFLCEKAHGKGQH